MSIIANWLLRAAWVLSRLVLVIVLIPLAVVYALARWLFRIDDRRQCTPQELATDLRKFSEGKEGEWDWDDLESVSIKDPRLEAIRIEAIMHAELPLRPEDRAMFGRLAFKAEALAPQV